MKAEQLIKKNCDTGTYENMFPVTHIQSVKDAITGESLDSILEEYNHIYLPLIDRSRTLTRLQIPDNIRRRGLWISYISYNDNVITEWYDSDDFTDAQWGNSKNWKSYIDDNTIKEAVNKVIVDINRQIKQLSDNKVDKVKGKELSTNDLTDELKDKLESLNNYDDTELRNKIDTLTTNFNTLLNANPTKAIENFNEIIAFLKNIEDGSTLEGIIAGIELQIADINNSLTQYITKDKVNELLNNYATKEEINDINDTLVNKADTSEIPTNISQLTNDSGYQTKAQVNTAVANKVDKEEGKGLSTNDFTDEDKAKLDRFELVLADDDEIEEGLQQIATSEEYRSKLKENGYVVYHDVKYKVKDCGVDSNSASWIITEGAVITDNEEGDFEDHKQDNIIRSVYIWFDTILHYQPYNKPLSDEPFTSEDKANLDLLPEILNEIGRIIGVKDDSDMITVLEFYTFDGLPENSYYPQNGEIIEDSTLQDLLNITYIFSQVFMLEGFIYQTHNIRGNIVKYKSVYTKELEELFKEFENLKQNEVKYLDSSAFIILKNKSRVNISQFDLSEFQLTEN